MDELYRLTLAAYAIETGLQDEAYTYDPVGNRETENGNAEWQYNANHQLESQPGITYAYDDNGHTVTKTEGATVTTYEYDLDERMKTVKQDGTTLGSYQYDPFGRRVSKTTASGTVYFHYDDTGLLAEYDASGTLINEYQYTPGSTWMTKPLFKRDGAGKLHYYYNSHLGQPLKLFDKTGKVTWEGRSQAFGATEVVVAETDNALRFPGQYWDGETGLHYNTNRYYSLAQGRYLQSDPLGMLAGVNYYGYVGAAPVDLSDPLGLCPETVGGCVDDLKASLGIVGDLVDMTSLGSFFHGNKSTTFIGWGGGKVLNEAIEWNQLDVNRDKYKTVTRAAKRKAAFQSSVRIFSKVMGVLTLVGTALDASMWLYCASVVG